MFLPKDGHLLHPSANEHRATGANHVAAGFHDPPFSYFFSGPRHQ
jgi:hypothetical protein